MRPFKGPHDAGTVTYTTAGTYTWTVPTGVTSICVLCVGPGGACGAGQSGGGGGGALAYANAISVTPGANYTVVVGSSGSTDSSFAVQGGSTLVLAKRGDSSVGTSGAAGGAAASCVGDAKYSGGAGGNHGTLNGYLYGGGGGGAAGYAGNGGAGGSGGSGTSGSGGGGGGGAGYPSSFDNYVGRGGGGVGLQGQGSSGAGGVGSSSAVAGQGGGGSGGTNGDVTGKGGQYGGGTGGNYGTGQSAFSGADGAVRIIWGPNRSFPSTNTGGV